MNHKPPDLVAIEVNSNEISELVPPPLIVEESTLISAINKKKSDGNGKVSPNLPGIGDLTGKL